MNFISPEILMQNAMKNHNIQVNNIRPPNEQIFNDSLNKYTEDINLPNQIYNNNNNNNNQIPNNNQIYGNNNNNQIPIDNQSHNNNQQQLITPIETFDFSKYRPVKILNNTIQINSILLLIIAIIVFNIILYLYCRLENMKSMIKLYETIKH
jgi:hypothetical protein